MFNPFSNNAVVLTKLLLNGGLSRLNNPSSSFTGPYDLYLQLLLGLGVLFILDRRLLQIPVAPAYCVWSSAGSQSSAFRKDDGFSGKNSFLKIKNLVLF